MIILCDLSREGIFISCGVINLALDIWLLHIELDEMFSTLMTFAMLFCHYRWLCTSTEEKKNSGTFMRVSTSMQGEAQWDENIVTNILPAHGVNCDSEAENKKGW